uniref:Ankyrin repeat domain-containing protein 53 n=1 Tax=Leptobrachium leishanense TaxID=445787 RepID=A0A8C5P8W2_9ANUR
MPGPQRSSKNSPHNRTLKKSGPDSGRDQLTAATSGNVHFLRLCMHSANGKLAADREGFTALHQAALHYRIQCLKILVEEFNVNVNLPTHFKWRPIHLVLNQKDRSLALECAQYLIKHGADVNVQAMNKVTPLHKAASEGLKECIELLVDAGADLHAKDSRDFKPIDLCKIGSNPACARYLRNVMWKKQKEEHAREVKKLERIKKNIYEEEKVTYTEFKKQEEFHLLRHFHDWIDAKGFPGSLKEKFGCRADTVPASRHLHDCFKVSSNEPQDKAAPFSIQDDREPDIGHGAEDKMDTFLVATEGAKHQDKIPSSDIRGWNPSVNPSMAPTTKIMRPIIVRVGTQPEKAKKEGFNPFVSLTKARDGNLKVKTISGRIHSLSPKLPEQTIERSLFPNRIPRERVHMPEEFQASHVIDCPRINQPSNGYQSEIIFHLQQNLDPNIHKTTK